MRLAIFGLVCFWSGVAAIIARLCGWPVLILVVFVVAVGSFAAVSLLLITALCQAAGTEFPQDQAIDIQTYFGGTFRMRNSAGGMES